MGFEFRIVFNVYSDSRSRENFSGLPILSHCCFSVALFTLVLQLKMAQKLAGGLNQSGIHCNDLGPD
jgi:hypothetical protein